MQERNKEYKERNKEEGVNAHAQEEIDFSKINDLLLRWGESDDGVKKIRQWKRDTGYSDKQHGPTTDEVAKFISYHLQKQTSAMLDNPLDFFQRSFPGWLINAKTMNRPAKHPPPNATYYTPPPHQRSNRSSETQSITQILKR